MKLYNSGSFFDPRAVPETDYEAIASLLNGLERVIVESHPSLIGPRVDRFMAALERLAPGTSLEVAMGLETAHPGALQRLNKRMDVDNFAAAAERIRARGIALRAFLLVSPPFIESRDQDFWLLKSTDFAVACGATAVSLIPTRAGNGAMEVLEHAGLFAPPRLSDIERAFDLALAHAAAHARVFMDNWDLGRFSSCARCFEERRARLNLMNLDQRVVPSVTCDRCGSPTYP